MITKQSINHRHFLIISLVLIMSGSVQEAQAQRAVIALDKVEIYSLPLVDDFPTAALSKGDTVRIIGQRGGWVKIEFTGGKKGWMQIQIKKEAAKNDRRRRQPKKPELARNGHAPNANHSSNEAFADLIKKQPDVRPQLGEQPFRRFGYSFGMGLVELDYTYNWKFVFHQTRRTALEGSFKHVLGGAADSYFIMANLSYLLKKNTNKKWLPYVTGGMGVINTVPDRSIDADGVSNMAINYGIGARKFFKKNMSFIFSATQYTAFVGKGLSHFRELTVGFLVGKFWDIN